VLKSGGDLGPVGRCRGWYGYVAIRSVPRRESNVETFITAVVCASGI
jgi:hypothetical protein